MASGYGCTNSSPIPQQSAPKIIHPKKDKSKTNKSIFYPVVICLDKEKAWEAERFGFSANRYGIIEYS